MGKPQNLLLALQVGLAMACCACDSTDPDGSEPTCSDGRQNGNETGIDCGGSCAPCDNTIAQAVPLLAEGDHLNFVPTWQQNPPIVETALESSWTAALSNGMKTSRVEVHWSYLEPTKEVYSPEALEELLAEKQMDDLGVFLTVETGSDTFETMPPDLVDPEDFLRLKDGMALDDPVILNRFRSLLDWVVPMAVDYGVFTISVGNEPNNRLDELSGAAADEWVRSVAGFVKSARQHIHTIEPRMAVTITQRNYPASSDNWQYVQTLVNEVDVMSFNFYCQDEDFTVEENVVAASIDRFLQLRASHQLILQELGCPAGWENHPSVVEGTLTRQDDFIADVIAKMQSEPRFRVATYISLVDFSPEAAGLFVDPLRDIGLDEMADLVDESYQTMGLLRFEDGSPKPAWETFLQGIQTLSQD